MAVSVVLYAVYFLAQEIYPGFRRLDVFVWLMIPDVLLGATIDAGSIGSQSQSQLQSQFLVQFQILDRSLPLGLVVAWLGLSTWIGRPLLGKLRSRVGRAEYFALCCLAGLSLLSTVMLLLGLAGGLSRSILFVVVGVLAITSLLFARKQSDAQEIHKASIPELQQGQISLWLWRLIPVGTVAIAVAYVLSSLMPAFEFDVVEYHLQGPKEFYQAGRIAFSPHNVYLNMPLAAEMHSLAMMVLVGGEDAWWLGGIAGKGITGSFSLLSALLVGGFVARHFGNASGWASAAMLLSAPGNLHVAGCGLIDAVVGAYLLACVVCLAELINARAEVHFAKQLASLSALGTFFAGSAAACKYPGLVFGVLPCLVVVILVGQRLWLNRAAIKPLAVCGLALAITASPWYLRNLVATGNPFYPLVNQWLGAGNLTGDQAQRWNQAHQVPSNNLGSKYGWSAVSASSGQILVRNEFMPVTLVPLVLTGCAAIPFALRRNRSGTRNPLAQQIKECVNHPAFIFVCITAWIFLAWFFLTHRIDRFWLPALPLLSIIAGITIHWLYVNRLQAFAAGCVMISLLYGGLISLSNLQCDSRWFVSYQSLRQDVGSKESPGRLPATIGWVNENLSREAKLLLIGQAQAFRFERPVEYATCFNTPIGEESLSNRSAEDQRKWLNEAGFTHILVQWSEIDRYRSPGNYGFSTWPTREDIENMVQSGVVRRITDDWPVEASSAELLEVN